MKTSAKEALFDDVDRILWDRWDPIGVNDNDNARDEYRGYVPSVVQLLCTGADAYKLTEHFRTIEHASMGLTNSPTDPGRTAAVQELLDAYRRYT